MAEDQHYQNRFRETERRGFGRVEGNGEPEAPAGGNAEQGNAEQGHAEQVNPWTVAR